MSKKQELIQLHQLFANMSYFLDGHESVSFDRDDLSRYKDVPIDSLDVNTSVDKQRMAVFALAKDINEGLAINTERKQATITNWVETPTQQAEAFVVDESDISETSVTHPVNPATTAESYPSISSNPDDPDVQFVPVKDTVEKTRVRAQQKEAAAEQDNEPKQTVETLELFFDDLDADDTSQPVYENTPEQETTENFVQATITT